MKLSKLAKAVIVMLLIALVVIIASNTVMANSGIVPTTASLSGTFTKTDESGAYIQAYTLHILKPIYPDEGLTQQENVAYMLKENERQCKEIYEQFYGVPLKYLPEEK